MLSLAGRCANDSLQHDGTVAVLFPRESAEHLRRIRRRARSTRRSIPTADRSVSPLRRSPTSIPARRTSSIPAIFALSTNTLDDPFNPRTGMNGLLSETLSVPALGSNFQFTQTTLGVARFFPVLKTATLGFHLQLHGSTRRDSAELALYVFRSADARVQPGLLRHRCRSRANRAASAAGARPTLSVASSSTSSTIGFAALIRCSTRTPIESSDIRATGRSTATTGPGIRFDVPQLGLHTIRIDFARGVYGTHTSFGIGQSF